MEIYRDAARTIEFDFGDGWPLLKVTRADGNVIDIPFGPQRKPRVASSFTPKMRDAMRKQGIDPATRFAVDTGIGDTQLVMPNEARHAVEDAFNSYEKWHDQHEAELEAERNKPENVERRAIDKLFADADRIENSERDDNVETPMRLRMVARERLKAWREKYQGAAAHERAESLRADAEHERDMASGALTYDADGWIGPKEQQRRHDEFIAKAEALEAQAKVVELGVNSQGGQKHGTIRASREAISNRG